MLSGDAGGFVYSQIQNGGSGAINIAGPSDEIGEIVPKLECGLR